MPLENLWGLLGSSGAGAANLAGTINDPNLGPTGWSSSGQAEWNPQTSDSGWKWPSSKELAETLKGAGKSLTAASSGDDADPKGSSLIGSSGAHAGSGGISADAVYKLLMARATPTGGQQKQGLLGV